MVEIFRAARRFGFKNAWLDARWHFSFGHYRDIRNMGFGPLRVFNDDVIQGKNGFPMHDHAEMEIITYVIDGELTHTDSTGGSGVLRAGDLQRMTAGTGIEHSEFNNSDKPVHLLQLWILPAVSGLEPGYEQKTVATTPGVFTAVVSGKPRGCDGDAPGCDGVRWQVRRRAGSDAGDRARPPGVCVCDRWRSEGQRRNANSRRSGADHRRDAGDRKGGRGGACDVD